MKVLLFLFLFGTTALFGQEIARGPVVGAVTDSSARILLQLTGPGAARVQLSPISDFSAQVVESTTGNAEASGRYFITLDISGLHPSTQYYIRPVINATPRSLTPVRSFRTYPKSGVDSSFTFVFGSCSRYDSATRPSRVFKLMQEDAPLFFLHMGDWDYPDYEVSQYFTDRDSTIAQAYERKYLTHGGMDTLLMNCAVDYVYDDHDYIGNNADGTWRTRDKAVAGYTKYFPHYPLPNAASGIWHKFSAGNLDVFVFDLRSARSPDTNAYQLRDSVYTWEPQPGHSMLRGAHKSGEDQLAWFLRELKASKARWKFIVSSVNWNPGMRKQLPLLLAQANASKSSSMLRTLADTWLGFIEEQDSIIAFVQREGITNVIVGSGDVHTAMMDDGTNAVFPEIVSANLQNYNSNVYGTLVSLGLADEIWNRGGQIKDSLRTYGRVTVRTEPVHSVLLEIVDENDKIVAFYEVIDTAKTTSVARKQADELSAQLRIRSEERKSIVFSLVLPARERVNAYVIDSMGKIVAQVLHGELPAGETNFPVRKGLLASGAYRLILEAGAQKLEQRFIVVK